MAIKSKSDSYKEKINKSGAHSSVRYINTKRVRNINVKKKGNIKYASKELSSIPYVKTTKNALEKQQGIYRRTHTLHGSISYSVKDAVNRNDEYNQPSMGVQAVLYTADKIDAAVDVIYSSKRVIRAVKNTKQVANNFIKGTDSKKELIKRLTIKKVKADIIVLRNIGRQASGTLQSEDTDLGIKSMAEAEKEIRKTYDTVIAIKNTSVDAYKFTKTVRNKSAEAGDYVKNKIYSNRAKKFDTYKDRARTSEGLNRKIKTDIGTNNFKYSRGKVRTNRAAFNSTIINRPKASISSGTAVETTKKIVALILPDKKVIFLLLGAVCVFFIFSSIFTGIVPSMSQQYFMIDDDIAEIYRDEIEILDGKLKEEISDLSNDNSYDDVKVIYIGDIQGINTNFQEIFAAATVEFEQNISYSKDEEKFIEEIYGYLYDIKVTTESYTVTDRNGDEIDKVRKIITVYSYDIESAMNKIKFDEEQKSWTRRLASGFGEQFPEFAERYGELTQEEIRKLIDNAPKLANGKQQSLYDTALSIVGRVKYFWGGKSPAGWNKNWGRPTLVTADGSETTGKHIPYGLDCSGYVDWVYKTAGIGNMLSGGGTAYQFGQSYPIHADELQIGDLAFLQMPNSSGINHVGIYIGKDKDNNNLYAHCEWGTGVTVNGFKGFKYFRRVVNFEQE